MSTLEHSREILYSAIEALKPQAIVSLVSGGDDSVTAYHVASELYRLPLLVIHVDTGTGIVETRQFVEQWTSDRGVQLLVQSAGDTYARYVMRKGFFGRGLRAHSMAYHVLKADPLRKAISSIRQRRQDFPVLMLTGIRLDESENRKYNFANQTVKRDGKRNQFFVNIIEHWTKQDCQDYLREAKAPRNPVSKALHRSGECMCGTMQSAEDRQLASILYPNWGRRLNELESQAIAKHGWGWG